MAAQGFSPEAAITAVAALQDELRRSMFDFIRRAQRPVTREEAAATVGISRKLAGFHLDKLVEAGLLTAQYNSAGRVRRVGRAPKVYEASDAQICISIPHRQAEMLADVLVDAVLSDTGDTRDAALRVAAERGRELGTAERARARPGRLGAERALTLAADVLERNAFELTRDQPGVIQLRNCPFHPLAARAPELVCGINHAFLTGVLHGLGGHAVDAVLNPHAGRCCVELRPAR